MLGDSSAEIFDEPQMAMSAEPFNAPAYLNLQEAGSSSPTVHVELTNFDEKLANLAEDKNQRPSDASQLRTGRLGEALVEKYFAKQLGSNNVRWVNNRIVITHPEGFTEYVEVKTTVFKKRLV